MEQDNISKDQKKLLVWCVFAFAIIINIYLYVHILRNFPHLLNDFESPFLMIAENMYEHGKYTMPIDVVEASDTGDYVPDTRNLPVAPIIGYLVFLIFGVGSTALEVLRIILILSNFGIIILVYHIGKIFNYKIGCAAAFLAAADLSMFCWGNNFKPDMLYAFLSTLSIYFLVRFVKCRQSKKNIILASFILGLAVLTKGALYLLFPLIAVFLLVFLLFIRRNSFSKSLYYVSLFVVIQLVFIMGWQTRNYHATGVYSFISTKVGATVFYWNIARLVVYQEGVSLAEARKILKEKYDTDDTMKLTDTERCKYLQKIAFKIILNSPLDYAIATLKYSPAFFVGTVPPDYLFTNQRREELFEEMGIKLHTEYSYVNNTSLPMVSKREASYLGALSSFPILKKLWNRNQYSYIFLWSMIKSHILLIYLMTIIGSFLILKDKSDRWVFVLMVLIVVYYVAIIGIGPVASRVRCTLMPIFYFLSSYGLIWLGKVLQQFVKRRSWNEKAS